MSVSRPIELFVLNCCVTDTNDAACASKILRGHILDGDFGEVLVPALRRLKALDLGRHYPRIQIVHDKRPRRLVEGDGMGLSRFLTETLSNTR